MIYDPTEAKRDLDIYEINLELDPQIKFHKEEIKHHLDLISDLENERTKRYMEVGYDPTRI